MADKLRTLILVAGMHRSGTSALTRCISLLGAKLPQDLIHTTKDNPRGYWESKEVVLFHQEVLRNFELRWDTVISRPNDFWSDNDYLSTRKWIQQYIKNSLRFNEIFLIKDPRLCRLLKLWIASLEEENVNLKIVIPFRIYSEVSISLHKRDLENDQHSGEGFNSHRALLLYLRYNLEAERDSRGQYRTFVSYTSLLNDWRLVVNKITSELDLVWSTNLTDVDQTIDNFLVPELNRSGGISTEEKLVVRHEWLELVYHGLQLFEQNPYDKEAMRIFDEVSEKLNTASELFDSVILETRDKYWAELKTVDNLKTKVKREEEKIFNLTKELSQSSSINKLLNSELVQYEEAKEIKQAQDQMLIRDLRHTLELKQKEVDELKNKLNGN